jgi:hypothetical protein
MRDVLDGCTGFKWLVVEQRQAIHELIAPDVFPIEVSHALTRAYRQGEFTTAQGAQLMADTCAPSRRRDGLAVRCSPDTAQETILTARPSRGRMIAGQSGGTTTCWRMGCVARDCANFILPRYGIQVAQQPCGAVL